MKLEDPIVGEVRAVRDAIAKEHGYDLQKIAAAAAVLAESTGRQLVTRPPRRVKRAS